MSGLYQKQIKMLQSAVVKTMNQKDQDVWVSVGVPLSTLLAQLQVADLGDQFVEPSKYEAAVYLCENMDSVLTSFEMIKAMMS